MESGRRSCRSQCPPCQSFLTLSSGSFWVVRLWSVFSVVLSSTVGRRLHAVFTTLRTGCAFSVAISPRRRDHARLLRLLGSITSYSRGLSYQVGRNGKLRFALLGKRREANVAFQTIPGKRRFDSLLLTVLGASKGKGGFPSRNVYGQMGSLGKPIHLAACISLAYAGYPSIIRTLGTVAALGKRVRRRAISKTVGRTRMRTLGVRKIPSIFTSNGLVRIKHNSFNRLLTGLRRRCKARAGDTRASVGGCSIVMTNKNPTNSTTTVCSTHGNLGMTIVTRQVNKRMGRAMNVRGLVSMPSAAKDRLTSGLGARVSRCPVSLLRRHRVRGVRLSKGSGILATGKKRHFSTPTMVITANTD